MARNRRKKDQPRKEAEAVDVEAPASDETEAAEAESEAPKAPASSEAPPPSARRSGGATAATFGLAPDEPLIVVPDLSPSPELPRRWNERRGNDLGPATIKFAAISVQEERDQHVPLEGNEAYIIEWRFDGTNAYPTACVPPQVARVLRSLNDRKRKYAEL